LLETAGSGGGAAGRTLATAGAVGGVLGKGGVAIKVLSALVFLPAFLQGAQDFVRFQDRNSAQDGATTQRQAAWAYFRMHAGIGLFCLGAVVLPALFPDHTSPWILAPFVLVGLGATWLARRAKCQMDRLMPRELTKAARRGFERRSAGSLLGLPFYHIRLGTGGSLHAPAVKAWVAISDGRAFGGWFAFGPFALAPVSMGIGSVGLLSIGVVALGGGALGILAGGWLSDGFVAIGGLAAKGVAVHAPFMASRHADLASLESASAAQVFFQHSGFYHFTAVAVNSLMWAGLVGWVMPVALTGWQLWRTRRGAV